MLERAGVSLVGEHVKHIAVGRVATAEISAVGFQREDIDINILSPSKFILTDKQNKAGKTVPGE